MVLLRGYVNPRNYWRAHHPTSHFPPELELSILLHQIHSLRALTLPPNVALGTAVSDPGYEFLGSAITKQQHESGLVDLDDQETTNELIFAAYSRMWHEEPRHRYAGERIVPTDVAFRKAHEAYEEQRKLAESVRPLHPLEKQQLETQQAAPPVRQAALVYTDRHRHPPSKKKAAAGLGGKPIGRDMRPMAIEWVGARHLVVPLQTMGGALVIDAETRRCRALVGSGRGNHHVLVAAGHSATADAPPSALACGGLSNLITVWDGRGPCEEHVASMVGEAADAPPPLLGAQTTEPRRVLHGHVGYISALAFSPTAGGTRLLSGSGDGTIRVWDVDSGRLVMGLLGHMGDVTCLKLAGAHLACTTSTDGTCRVWDVRTGGCERLFTLTANPMQAGGRRSLESCDIASDGSLVAALAQDGKVGIFDVGGYASAAEWRVRGSGAFRGGRFGVFGETRNNIALVDGGRSVALASNRGVVGAFRTFAGHGRGNDATPSVAFGTLPERPGPGEVTAPVGDVDACGGESFERCMGIAVCRGGAEQASSAPAGTAGTQRLAAVSEKGSLEIWSWR